MTLRVMTILLYIPLILVGGWLDEVEWHRYPRSYVATARPPSLT